MTTVSLLSIAETERESGIHRDTLRVWERRYGFPAPLRNERGERAYTDGQLNRLRLLKQLLDCGMRPAKIIHLDENTLRQLANQLNETTPVPALVDSLLEALIVGPRRSLEQQLEELLQKNGLRNFLIEVVAPMNHAVGDAWFSGRIGVLDEHYYSEVVIRLLNAELSRMSKNSGYPRVLLTTLPGEQHGIGLLMAACMLCLEGAETFSLGVQTPLDEIVRGAVESQCNIVGLSCSEYMNRRTISSQLVRLRKLLPAKTSIWAGGSGVSKIQYLPTNIQLFAELHQIPSAIEAVKNKVI
ncbi:MAG: MerR family transcriptional regulator [Desulfuromonadales bacterium]|nr:MerR family transcriptional regulator [Desulfuromonadales bacterium]